MEAIDIITAVKNAPDHAGKTVAWVGKLEEQSAGEMTFLVRRKLIKDDQIYYLVRVALSQPLDLSVGDKVLITGSVPSHIDAETVEPGHINFYVDLVGAEVMPITTTEKGTVNEFFKEAVE
ncbi:MAG: hypothetical protein SFY70_02480 [Bacteroidia bacterium]|nr:hypothetical protein [Bacteroidia bacterium]